LTSQGSKMCLNMFYPLTELFDKSHVPLNLEAYMCLQSPGITVKRSLSAHKKEMVKSSIFYRQNIMAIQLARTARWLSANGAIICVILFTDIQACSHLGFISLTLIRESKQSLLRCSYLYRQTKFILYR